MANCCDFVMRVVGKKVDCEEWFKRMNDESSYHHFYMNEVVKRSEEGNDERYMIDMEGYCNYSLEYCMNNKYGKDGIDDIYELNTRELHIEMEAWSCVEGDDFQEHMRYEFGEQIEYDTIFFDERVCEDEFEDFEEFAQYVEDEYDEYIEEDDVDENGEYIVGGFDDYGYYCISI